MSTRASGKERLGNLSEDKRALIRLLREEKSRQTQQIKKYPRVDGTRLPTSLAQQRLWFIDQLGGGSAGYTVLISVRLRGALDDESVQRGLDALIQRHEVLRTVFVSVDGNPVQEICAGGRFPLRVLDLSACDEREREAQVSMHAIEESHAKFDLRHGPLIRGRLLRLHAREHVLLVTMHHIIGDGWSKGVFFREFAELYKASREGRGDPLQVLPIQYADYAQWHRAHWLTGEALDKSLGYWRTRLQGAAPQLELPTDRPRPAVQSYRGKTVRVVLDAQLSARLRALALRHEMTLFMVLYAGWSILLSRLSGQEDVVVGTPIANRQRPEVEGLIGLFVNTLVLRVGARDDMRLAEFLQQVKEVTLGAYDHQDVPFEKVVEELQPQRSLSRNPLFQVMFVLHNWPKSELQLPGVTATLEGDVDEPSILDLWMSMEERGDQIVGAVNYATDLFDQETVERWIACFAVLLRGMTDRPHSRIGDLPLLPDSERNKVIELFNPASAVYPQESLIHEIFEKRAEQTPDAPAVIGGDRSLTYRELNGQANRLARHLRANGAGADQLIAICVERSLDMVVGLLGILKAGAAYVPLDPNYPAERLLYMLKDAAPKVLLTQERLRTVLPDAATQVISLDGDWQEIAANESTNLALDAASLRADRLAYVIYTSGSTGEPKGVMVEHRNVTRLFAATQKWFSFNEHDVWTLFHSFAFDFSVWELWGALLYGGRVVVVPYLTARSPQDFYRLLCKEGVTVLNQTPSAFAQLIDAEERSGGTHALRVVIFGGEALDLRTLRPWVKRNGAERTQLVNMYGITETTVHVTYRRLSAEEIESERGSVVGRPIPDLQIYLLDANRQPVPIGVAGEIFVGGAGLARGYLNRQALTAERFLANPFSSDLQARMYKSGDLARWRADGTLEYLGRNDHQVKVRGFRIELGEIEAQIARHACVKEAVVMARQDTPGEKRLVAYVTAKVAGAEGPSAEALHAHLSAALPDYMVPSAFVHLEQFPLTSNGKLDRAALPAPDQHAVPMRQHVAPRNDLERQLCKVWAQVLGLERVGIDDNFFAIGGDSVLSLRVVARAQAAGVTFGVADLFRNQNIAQLAHAIATGGAADAPRSRVAPFELLSAAEQTQFAGLDDIVDAYPLSLLQEGMYFHSELAPDSAVYHDIFSYRIEAPFQQEHFERAACSLVERHPILRTGFVMSCDHRLVQIVRGIVSVGVHVEDLSQLSPQQQDGHIRSWVDREKHHGFAWADPPLVRIFVHTRGADRFQYSLSFHHSILDGWSVASLQTELIGHYFDLMEGTLRVISAPQAMYRDFVARERQALQSSVSREYWKELLKGSSRSTLPRLDEKRAQGRGKEVATWSSCFAPRTGAELERRARHLGVHLKLLLLAAHVKVMSAICGERTVLTGMVSHGRPEEEDGERVLGLHLNSLPVCLDLPDGSWRELVLRLRDMEEAMFPHRHYPLAAIQELVHSDQLFDTLFNFTRFHVYRQVEEALKVSDVEGFEQTNFSLLVNFSQALNGPAISLSISFDPAVFDQLQIERMGGYYQRALQGIIDDIDARHDAQTLLAEAETNELLRFNHTATPYPSGRRVHELVEEQAHCSPDASALVHGAQSLTYAELNAKANQLARHLRDLGVGPDELVGICVERSLDMVVALLAVLKAGGAYVPFDPNYPAERLQHMLSDAAPRVVLTQAKLRHVLPGAAVIALDASWSEIASRDVTNLPLADVHDGGDGLVYVIYTSGSTGQPKGTAMAHHSMVNLIEWQRQSLPEGAGKRVLQFAALSFDVAFQETFSTLGTGGTLVLLDEWVRRDAHAMLELLSRHRIQRLFLPPLMLQSLAECSKAEGAAPTQLEDVITAGEQLRITPEIISFFERLPGCRLHNHYGPTETHVVTALTLQGQPGEWPTFPTIGRPIANAKIYVLDRNAEPVPIGVAAEIYIGGAAVARGYLRRPELTEQRFVSDPFSGDSRARMYKTGDLGRWLADGTLEYLGRNDDQVKIRGYRIELGEIEAQLARHAQVKEAAVVVRADGGGEKRLVAYVTRHGESGPSVEELRAHLRALLPEHMVPSAFMVLEDFPLTPSGKLARRALPAPDPEAYTSRPYEPPQGEVEARLAQIWHELLQIERVGREDNFFELGGHSLLGMKLIALVGDRFKVRLSVLTVFQFPVLHQMAEVVESLAVFDAVPPGSRSIELDEGVL